MKIFISQPMAVLKNEDIIETRNRVEKELKERYGDDVIILSSFYIDDEFENNTLPDDQAMEALGKSIALMSEADLVFFAKGWNKSRGCSIENLVANQYGKEMIVENNGGRVIVGYTKNRENEQ